MSGVSCGQSSRTASPDVPVNIVATDSGYVVPDTLHVGLNHIVYENHGSTIHECMFIRLPDGMDPANYIADVKADIDFPKGATDCSGPGLTSPGERVELWIPLEAGRYLLACWFKNHLVSMTPHTIVVTGEPAKSVLPPREDVTLRLVDFRFELTGGLDHGPRVIRVETVGPSMHECDIYRLDGGRSVAELRAWHANHKEGPPPGSVMGGILDSHDLSRVVWLKRNFTMGRYVFWCEMPMVQNAGAAEAAESAHVTHADAGMVLEVTVD